MWAGIDQVGNPISVSFNDKQVYDDILVHNKLKPEDPRNPDSKMIPVFDYIEHRPKYTLPFNEANLQELYDLKNGRCALVLQDMRDRPPMAVDSYEAFKKNTI